MTNSPSHSFGPFEATHWPLVEQAAQENPLNRQSALAELLQRYRPALRAHLVFKRQLDLQSAEDVLQGFISDKIVERNILRLADPSKGQFRLLLLKSLDNYLRDEWRRANRRCETQAALDESAEPEPPINQADVFDVAWARQVLTQVLARMRNDCESTGRSQVWEIFLGRVWLTAASGREIESYESMVSRLGLESPAQASNLLMTAKRQFRRTLEAVISEYVITPTAVMVEVTELQRILASGRDVLVGLPFDQLNETPHPLSVRPRGTDRQVDASLPWHSELYLAAADTVSWNERDLAALLQHQLNLPWDHPALGGPTPGRLASDVEETQPRSTLLQLFSAANPSVAALRQVKDLCKAATQSPEPAIPKELALLLYYVAIGVAQLRTGESISSSSGDAIAEGILRVLVIPWCPPELRRMLADAYIAIRSKYIEPQTTPEI